MIGLESIQHWAAQGCVAVKDAVEHDGGEAIGQFLRTVPIGDAQESIVPGGEAYAFSAQLARQPAMAVAIELQAERRPGWNAHIDQAKLLIDEIEIIVQAFACVRAQESLVRFLVVPRLVGAAGFHGRDDMSEARMIPALSDRLGDNVLLADMALRNMLDADACRLSEPCRVLPHFVAQRSCELRIIENADGVRVKKRRHAFGVTDARERAGDHDAVVAGKNSSNPLIVAFNKPLPHRPLANRLRPLPL